VKNAFGDFIREKRLALGLSMRSFAREVGMQPSNYCNVENGVLPPPSAEGVERIAVALRLEPASSERVRLLDLAAEARREVPADIAKIVRENELIPALLRTVESEHVSEEKLRGIIEDLRHGRHKRA
jgi:transcriptional regulator with XRE-family HTH domain